MTQTIVLRFKLISSRDEFPFQLGPLDRSSTELQSDRNQRTTELQKYKNQRTRNLTLLTGTQVVQNPKTMALPSMFLSNQLPMTVKAEGQTKL